MSIGLTDENALDNNDPVLTTKEGKQYSNKVLRRMAAEADTDCISGRSVQLEWLAYFCCQKTLDDYAND